MGFYINTKRLRFRAVLHNSRAALDIAAPGYLSGMHALAPGLTLRDVRDGKFCAADLPAKLRFYTGEIRAGFAGNS